MDQETILLVDDEDIILDVNREILETMGYRVLTASTGREALEVYGTHSGEIDLVILDMIMPDIRGGEIFAAMKNLNAGVRVLLSSGYILNDEAARLMEQGCNAFIQKPFRINDFLAKIREILGKPSPLKP
jgi:DNA-binding NtrC family response regulator